MQNSHGGQRPPDVRPVAREAALVEPARGARRVAAAHDPAGVQLGDVIISVNHTLVDAHDQAIGLVDAAPDTVQLVLRAEAASYIPSLH